MYNSWIILLGWADLFDIWTDGIQMQGDNKSLTCFLLDFTEDSEQCRLHTVAVQAMFPDKTHSTQQILRQDLRKNNL